MRKIEYNSQRDNFDFGGQFKGSCQCFSTSAWMFLSYYSPDILAGDDDGLKRYVDDVSNIVGTPGIGEQVAVKDHSISGNSAYWWQVHKAAIEKKFSDHLYPYPQKVIFREQTTIDELRSALANGPVILGTRKLAGLPGGHIILAVDIDGENIICDDPYGDANTNYKNVNGAGVSYSPELLAGHIGAAMWAE
ncbi:MAG TPA: papain-like cysteine protease family protein [Candidatus Omnitrophota bacterium]|nr:papain-like cysteine protease family protein [Candidatus Omnitrophota bacterium]